MIDFNAMAKTVADKWHGWNREHSAKWVCSQLTKTVEPLLREAYMQGRKDENAACAKALIEADLTGEHELCVDEIRERIPNETAKETK